MSDVVFFSRLRMQVGFHWRVGSRNSQRLMMHWVLRKLGLYLLVSFFKHQSSDVNFSLSLMSDKFKTIELE